MTLTQAQKEAYARANTDEVVKHAIELRHSLFPSPFRLINHDKDALITLEADAPVDAGTQQTFTAAGLRLKEPEESREPDPTIRIEIDGVSGTLQPFLRPAIVSGEPVLLTFRSIIYDVGAETVTQIQKIFHLQLRDSTTNMTTIVGTFGYTNAANQAFPSQKYDAITNPGLV